MAIIGAGASGLCAARYFKEAAFDVTVYEIGTQVGGLWCFNNDNGLSSAYKTLHINTAKKLTNFRDFKFPDAMQPFPSHRDMHAYFTSFVEHFGLGSLIRFNSRVTSVRPVEGSGCGGGRWRVETDKENGGVFDVVVVCSGHLSKPLHVERLSAFTGQYLHSHDYKEPGAFRRQARLHRGHRQQCLRHRERSRDRYAENRDRGALRRAHRAEAALRHSVHRRHHAVEPRPHPRVGRSRGDAVADSPGPWADGAIGFQAAEASLACAQQRHDRAAHRLSSRRGEARHRADRGKDDHLYRRVTRGVRHAHRGDRLPHRFSIPLARDPFGTRQCRSPL
ncbi:MAG: NAD(P)-binding protein [Hyphomicrobiales bacterium]|nr:NAD(P)-binding protein [Hyphomicrobiales bacterium]